MTPQEIIEGLEKIGFTLSVMDDQVCGDWEHRMPPPPETADLLNQLRQHKGDVMNILMERYFDSVFTADTSFSFLVTSETGAEDMLEGF